MSRRIFSRLAGAAAASVLLAALALPGSASAARGLTTGFAGTDAYQSGSAADQNKWLDRTVDAGAGIVRLSVGWAYVAPNRPTDPTNPGSTSYDFSAIDPSVRGSRARAQRAHHRQCRSHLGRGSGASLIG